MEFDFGGKFTKIIAQEKIEYILEDGREVEVTFDKTPDGVSLVKEFQPEISNPIELQKNGWQAILDNFKKYVEY